VKQLWDVFHDVSGFLDEAKQFTEREGDIKNSMANIRELKLIWGINSAKILMVICFRCMLG
jgi:hypothetical protein